MKGELKIDFLNLCLETECLSSYIYLSSLPYALTLLDNTSNPKILQMSCLY